MIHQILQLIRKTLIADSTVTGLVGMNIYPEHLSSKRNPSYPCITMHFEGDYIPGDMIEIGVDRILFQIWSETSLKQCDEIYDAIFGSNNLLHKQRLSDDNYHLVMRLLGRPKRLTNTDKDSYLYYLSAELSVVDYRR